MPVSNDDALIRQAQIDAAFHGFLHRRQRLRSCCKRLKAHKNYFILSQKPKIGF